MQEAIYQYQPIIILFQEPKPKKVNKIKQKTYIKTYNRTWDMSKKLTKLVMNPYNIRALNQQNIKTYQLHK